MPGIEHETKGVTFAGVEIPYRLIDLAEEKTSLSFSVSQKVYNRPPSK